MNTSRFQTDMPETPDAHRYAQRVANLTWMMLGEPWDVQAAQCPGCRGFLVIIYQVKLKTWQIPWVFHVKPETNSGGERAWECAARLVNQTKAAKKTRK